MKNVKNLVFCISVLIPSVALASPSIVSVAGNFSDGIQVTVNGSGFGASGPNIVLFDDFNRGNVSEKLSTNATIGTWTSTNGIAYSDKMLSNNRGCRTVGSQGWLNNKKTFGDYSEVFLSSRIYVPDGYRFPAAEAQKEMPKISALKHYWLFRGNNNYHKEPTIFGPDWTGGGFRRFTPLSTKKTYSEWGDGNWVWGKPVRWTYWLKGDINNRSQYTKGMFQAINDTSQIYKNYSESNMGGKTWFSPTTADEGKPFAWDRVNIPGYLRSGCYYPRDNYVIDDVYIAVGKNAAARVEIGNKSDYKSCTKMAISTPTSWSNTKINVTIREGNFNPGEKAYLFVVDANNNPSTGYPVTFGGTSTSSSSSTTSSSQPPPAPGKPFVVN